MPYNSEKEAEHKPNFRRDIKRFMILAGKYRGAYLFFMLASAGIGAMGDILEAETLRNIVSYFVDHDGKSTIKMIVIYIALYFFVSFLFHRVLDYFGDKMLVKMEADIRQRVFGKLQRLPVDYFHGRHSGDIIARINGDIEAARDAAGNLWWMAWLVFEMIFLAPYIIALDYRMGIIVIICGTLSALLTAKVIRPLRQQHKKIRETVSDMSSSATESVTGFTVIKMFGLEKKFTGDFIGSVDKIYETQRKFGNMEALIGFCRKVIGDGGRAISAIAGLVFAFSGTLPVASLAALTDTARFLIFTINDFAAAPAELQKAFASTDRLFELLESPEEPERYLSEGNAPRAGLMMKDIHFSYHDDNIPVVKGVSLVAEKGETIALVGDSGSGKSTLIKIICSLHSPDSGEMVINGKALSQYTLSELRGLIAYVPQDAYIFNGTIRDNISYGRESASEDEIIAAAKQANAEEFILKKPEGYETKVGERGIQLSGGERQRIAIARAILKNSPLLLLDEATSSLDSEVESSIQATLDVLMQGKTCVVVAHRLSTVVNADKIYVMHSGTVIGEGKHEELIESCEEYRELYYKDFK